MKRIRRALPLIVAVVLLGLATALALFAADVRAWQGADPNARTSGFGAPPPSSRRTRRAPC